ncbi:MAG TPA: alpha/beta hydrolase, partial [Planctomycetaceae bacterium]|nr:alpha/beta hydrolase [Planctomycetaceae bacterium]
MRRVLARLGSQYCCVGPVLMVLSALTASSSRAAPPANEVYTSEVKTLHTRDGGPLRITYYPSVKGRESPVVVLLHMKDGNRLIWQGKGGFAERLQHEGYAVITVDLRFHGESRPGGGAAVVGNSNPDSGKKGTGKKAASTELRPADYRAMWEIDVETVKNFIYEEHQAERLNMNKMGIVAAEMGAVIAVRFAVNDWMEEPHSDAPPGSGFETPRGQDVRALVLISPVASVPGIVMAQALQGLRPFPVAMSFNVSAGDTKDKGETKKLYGAAAAFDKEHKRIFLQDKYPGKLRGTDMLNAK